MKSADLSVFSEQSRTVLNGGRDLKDETLFQKTEKRLIILQSLSDALVDVEMYKFLEQGLSIQTQSLFKHKRVLFDLLNTLQVLVVRSSNVGIPDILSKQLPNQTY